MLLRFDGTILVAFSLAMLGCSGTTSPDLAPVSGTVTMDGRPLAGVVVRYYPQGEGKGSTGTTDAEGKYVLRYNVRLNGALLGMHNVQIITPVDENTGKPTGPIVPGKYNLDSTLTADVENKSNTFNFELQSN